LKKRRRFRLFLEKIFPKEVLVFLFAIYGFLKPPKRSYSQKGEDLLVYSYFDKRKTGFYLDIGCYHPKWISNTYLLHKKGWNGVALDIDQHKLDTFKFSRGKKVKVIKAAVIPKKTNKNTIDAYKFFSKRGWSDSDTLDPKLANKTKQNGRGQYIVEKVPCVDINSLLESIPKVDFLNIDIEGLDTKIVEAIDLDRFKIDLILFEDNTTYGSTKELVNKLEENGYIHLFTSGGSICYAKNKAF
tara:strand:+ start:83 stop:811 length:729 start_codon:yes stop_codon:yes gene_type:complete